MSRTRIVIVLSFVLALASASISPAQTIPAPGSEDKLIAVIRSADASRKEKVDACRQLAIIGSKKAVAPLAALLGDEQLSHMARYALEPIDDPAVDEALRAALARAKGRPLVGVIGSIGVRRDAKAAGALAKLLEATDADVARAAARALGSIGGPVAIGALQRALPRTSGVNQLAICEGLFRCAEAAADAGRRDVAIEIYDRMLTAKAHQVRGGALRGAILARGKDGVALLRRYLRSNDYIMFSAAVQTAQEMQDTDVTNTLTAALQDAPADNQILIIQTLGLRADPRAIPALAALARSGEKPVRIAAIKAMPDIGNAQAAPPLLDLLTDSDGEIAATAAESLAAIPGKEVDAAVMAMLTGSDTARQLKALELIERRRMTNVGPALLKATKSDDESVRTASIRILGDLADAKSFPLLVELLLGARSAPEIRAAERAISAACIREAKPSAGKVTIHRAVYGAIGKGGSADVTRKLAKLVAAGATSVAASNGNFGDPAPGIRKQLQVEFSVDGIAQTKTVAEGQTLRFMAGQTPKVFIEQLVRAFDKARKPQKIALLRILRIAQGPEALKAVRAATKNAETEVRAEAISTLCDWPSPDALDDVLELTRTTRDPKVRILSLRGAIRLIPLKNLTVAKKVAAFNAILPLIERDEEKRLLLGALAAVPSADALAMVMPHLDNAGTKNEASFAAVAIAERIVSTNARQVTEAMQQVLKVTENDQIRKRARDVLSKARSL